MAKTRIESGDVVSVNFNNAQITLCKRAKVWAVPFSTGDSWQLEDLDTGEIHYISEGCTLTLIRDEASSHGG